MTAMQLFGRLKTKNLWLCGISLILFVTKASSESPPFRPPPCSQVDEGLARCETLCKSQKGCVSIGYTRDTKECVINYHNTDGDSTETKKTCTFIINPYPFKPTIPRPQTIPNLAWVYGKGMTCEKACNQAGFKKAVKTEKVHPKVGAYFVCAADYKKVADRPGFQINGYHNDSCHMTSDHTRVFSAEKKCLCTNSRVFWVRDTTGKTCTQVCKSAGYLEPVQTDKVDIRNNNAYFVCAADYEAHGFRPGFQIDGYTKNQCLMTSGGTKAVSSDKKCLCQRIMVTKK